MGFILWGVIAWMNGCGSIGGSSLVVGWLKRAFPSANIVGRNGAVGAAGTAYIVSVDFNGLSQSL